jgi:hypothetical protein
MVGATHEESSMKLTVFAASLAFLLWGAAPVLAGPPGCVGPDSDGDLIDDCADNCSDVPNDLQFDADADFCGNVCDTDFNNSGLIGFDDFGGWALAFGATDAGSRVFSVLQPHTAPIGFGDFGQWALAFAGTAGPSGTTPGTTACP